MAFSDRIKALLQPVLTDDFEIYIEALSEAYNEVDDLVRDTVVLGVDKPGWSALVDLNRTPSYALPWLAQTVGATTVDGLSDADQRTHIAARSNQVRGTRQSFIDAAKLHLTGTKTILLRERDGGDAYALRIISYNSETPDPVQTLADLMGQKPAGIILTYQHLDGQDWLAVKTNYATWQDVKNHYMTWDGVKSDIIGI